MPNLWVRPEIKKDVERLLSFIAGSIEGYTDAERLMFFVEYNKKYRKEAMELDKLARQADVPGQLELFGENDVKTDEQ